MKIKIISFVLTLILLASCKTPKDIAYFQGIDALTKEQVSTMSQTYNTYICPDDLLTITVTAWDPSVVTPFNPPTYAYSSLVEGESLVTASPALYTYLVDQQGNIEFPVLGKIHVEGLTKQGVSELLQKEISKYVENPLVKVQIVNFKVTVMGEIARPGTIPVKNDRISILDAIGQMGDLTINANRKNLLIIRDNNGIKEFARMDLTDPSLLASPYFYLRQNDVVYIEPNKAKKKNSRYSQAEQYTITVFSSVIGAVSIITNVVITLINQSNKNKTTTT